MSFQKLHTQSFPAKYSNEIYLSGQFDILGDSYTKLRVMLS